MVSGTDGFLLRRPVSQAGKSIKARFAACSPRVGAGRKPGFLTGEKAVAN
jgi:hypothetical protein